MLFEVNGMAMPFQVDFFASYLILHVGLLGGGHIVQDNWLHHSNVNLINLCSHLDPNNNMRMFS